MKRRTLLLAKKGQEFDDADWSQGENMHLKMAKCDGEIVQSTIWKRNLIVGFTERLATWDHKNSTVTPLFLVTEWETEIFLKTGTFFSLTLGS